MSKSTAGFKKKELRGQAHDPVSVIESGVPEPFPFSDYAQAYEAHVWVYACVRAIATAGASVDILPYKKQADGTYVKEENNALHLLLTRPNPYMTNRNLREFILICLALTGNAFLALETMGGNQVKEIWPLPAGSVKPVSSPTKFIDHYVYDVGGHQIEYAPEEIIHFRDTSPTSMFYGQGSIAPVANSIISDLNAMTWNKFFFANGAKLDGVLETDNSLSDADYNRTIEGWKKMYVGRKNAGKTAVLDNGLKYRKIVDSMRDMDFVNLRKQVRDEVLAAFNVPPSIVGLLEFANYSNMREQQKTFWVNTVIPKLISISETLTMRGEQITKQKGSEFAPDTSTVEALRANETERAATTKTYVDAGVPINQVIEALDLPFEAVEGGDKPRQLAAPVNANPAPEPPPEPAKPAKTMAQNKAVDTAAEDKKAMEWRSFDANLSKRENAMEGSMRAFFKGQHRRVSKALDENASKFATGKSFERKTIADTVRILFDIDTEKDLMDKAAARHISGTYFEFAVSTAKKIKPGFDFNLKDPLAEGWISAKKTKLVQEANDYTLQQISDAVVDGVDQAVAGGFSASETIQQIADRIDEVFKFAVEGRAERIARTEVISAANAGSFEGMEKTGVEKKSWLSSRDGKVRDSHAALEEMGTVGIREPFVSPVTGAQLMFPGDPAADVSEIVNCRCTVLAE
jgi:HK97 family phage portal protein